MSDNPFAKYAPKDEGGNPFSKYVKGEKSREGVSAYEAAGRAAAQGFMGNFADEAAGAAAASPIPGGERQGAFPNLNVIDVLAGAGRLGLERLFPDRFGNEGGQRYDAELEKQRTRDKAAEAEYPVTTVIGNIGGAVANPLARAIAPTFTRGTMAGIGSGIAAGAGTGALYGFGSGEGTDDRMAKGATGGAVGGALGGFLGGVGARLFGPGAGGSVAGPTGQEVAEAAGRIGVDVPRAVATDSMVTQRAAATARNIPFAGDPLVKASERALGQVGGAADDAARAAGATTPANAGASVRNEIENVWGGRVKDTAKRLYDRVDSMVSPNAAMPLSATQAEASKIMAERAASRVAGSGKAVGFVEDAIKDPAGLTYEGVKGLRTRIGEMLANPQALANLDTSEKELRRIYGALTKDLGDVVEKAGGKGARGAWERANSFAAAAAKRKDELRKIVGAPNDEGIVERLLATASTKGRANVDLLRKARVAVGGQAWDELAGTLVTRLGRDTHGNFSPLRFLTDYGKISPEGKKLLFNPQLTAALDDIATVSSRFKDLQKFANPSGTGQTLMGGGIAAGVFADPVTTLGTVFGARAVASFLAQPATASSMAKWSRAYEMAVRKPGSATAGALERATRNFAATIGERAGVRVDPNAILRQIQGGAVAPAEDQGQN